MSPSVLSDADLAATTALGARRRAAVSVAEAHDEHVAELLTDFAVARAAGRFDVMQLIRDHAAAIDPGLVAELDGFDYLAAA
ncbi:MAG TPA: hypothetical protein VK698_39400 [Kofleriaceae bacterium]|nr:hypothetical protein [Kofleriaceae bacterium]